MSVYHATERVFDHFPKCIAAVFLIVVSTPFVATTFGYAKLSRNSPGIIGALFVTFWAIGIVQLLEAREEIIEGAKQ